MRILLADDHQVVRRGVAAVIQDTRPDWEVCGEASTGREAVVAAVKLQPDIVVMDLSMPDMGGLEATRQILKEQPQTKILILSMHESDQIVHEMLSAGARGYILKQDAGSELVSALEAVHENRLFFTPRVSDLLLNRLLGRLTTPAQPNQGDFERLSGRERQILKLIAESNSNKKVAMLLNISVKTVESHRARIMEKLELHSVAELVHFAIRNNIVEC